MEIYSSFLSYNLIWKIRPEAGGHTIDRTQDPLNLLNPPPNHPLKKNRYPLPGTQQNQTKRNNYSEN